ncbi:hypothetical protein [Parvularcula maris]|uniref:Uncharacterized protein n=1 Tax=Parvularcula maris TaxID=2965077 RepID=A0A9X2RK21_9PROT|nr:hypothetical protein [Parvularcula maris]MCQ8185328.1 hypothetical protein [Parvularcula maris]
MSWNGFRREAALRYAARHPIPNPFLMTVVLRRLNDWVPEVRRAAVVAAKHAAISTPASTMAEAASYVLPSFRDWGRIGENEIATLRALRAVPEVLIVILDQVENQHAGPMARLLGSMADLPAIDHQLPNLSRSAAQPAVRATATQWLLRGRAEWADGFEKAWVDRRFNEAKRRSVTEHRPLTIAVDWLYTLNQAASDPSPRVRRIAGNALIEDRAKDRPELQQIARQLTDDLYPSVAERGFYYLKHRM